MINIYSLSLTEHHFLQGIYELALFHKHLIVRAEVKNPLVCPDKVSKEWMPALIERIGMKVLMGPYAVYSDMEGNRGLTCATIIETSHIVMHIWDEDEPAMVQLDVYTCGPLDPYDVVEALAEMEPIHIDMKYLDREHDLIDLPVPLEFKD
jgi:S-adenosylmethionine/arginine decarboxylase-like enzyme